MPLIDLPVGRGAAFALGLAAPALIGAATLVVPTTRGQTAPPAVRLSPDTATRWVPFTLTPGNQIVFAMTLNGRGARALLDTGVSTSAASPGFARAAGLTIAASGEAEAIGGSVPIGWAASERMVIGALTRRDGRVAVLDLSPLTHGGRAALDMLVGADLLSCCALDIDYDARRFRLLPSGERPFAGAVAPLARAPDSGVYVSEISIGRRRLRPMIVDTGDGSAVTLSHVAWDQSALRPAATTTIAYGLGGAIETEVTIVPAVKIDSLTARNVELRREGPRGFSQRTGMAGRIGTGLLQRYRVLLDPGAGRMVLAPGRLVDVAPMRSTSGLLVREDSGTLKVLHVMRNSPAAVGGWRAGEAICAVDGQRVAQGGIDEWAAGAPGRTVTLDLCGGERRVLRLRTFY